MMNCQKHNFLNNIEGTHIAGMFVRNNSMHIEMKCVWSEADRVATCKWHDPITIL